MRARHEIPYQVDDGYKQFLGKITGKDDILAQLTSLTQEQDHIKAMLATLIENLNSRNVEENYKGNSNNQLPQLNEVLQKSADLQREFQSKFTSLENTLLQQKHQTVSISSLESQLRIINEKLEKIEKLEKTTTTTTSPGNSKPNSQSDEGVGLIVVISIVSIIVVALIGLAYFFLNRKSNPKKFV